MNRTRPLAFRTGVMFTTLHDRRTLAAGGETVSNDGLDMLADVYISDAKTATWTAVAPMPLARAWGAALTLRDGRVLVLGGTTKAGPTASAELYDPTTNRWSEAQLRELQTRLEQYNLLADLKRPLAAEQAAGVLTVDLLAMKKYRPGDLFGESHPGGGNVLGLYQQPDSPKK